MFSKSWIGVILMGALVAGEVWSEEVSVPPGVDTLNAAIDAAADGDTLILETGTYSCSDAATNPFLVDKSLTIRANTNAAEAMIGCTFTIAGADTGVVVQGLDFSTNINVDQAADVKILQNTLFNGADIDVTDYKTTEGDGALTVVGNHLTQNGNIEVIYSNDAYIAANVLDIGQIDARVPVWIVGNSVVGVYAREPDPPIEALPGTGAVQIIGNRVVMSGTRNNEGIDVNASHALIAANIVQVNHYRDDVYSNSYYETDGIRSSSGTNALVINNVVYGGSISYSDGNVSRGIKASGRIISNIVKDLNQHRPIQGLGSYQAINNLCYNSGDPCGSSPVVADPLLDADLKPTEGSPAINAGPDGDVKTEYYLFADLDRTRNDIGAYGGPWSIGQYDAQRDPLNYAPYVFPLFKANSAFTDGSVEVRALGVARLR